MNVTSWTPRRLAAVLLAGALLATLALVAAPARAVVPYPEADRIQGADAVAIGVNMSKRVFAPGSAGAVVLARFDTFPDALAASGVAGHFSAPILFTPRDHLAPAVRDEIVRVLPKGGTVFLMGGPVALSDGRNDPAGGVQDDVVKLGYQPFRFNGADRVQTAVLAAVTVAGPASSAIVVRSHGPLDTAWVDSVSCGAFAAENKTPVLLVGGDPNVVDPQTMDAIRNLGIRSVSICGGPVAVSQKQEDQLKSLLGAEGVQRYFGLNRVLTAVDVATRLWHYTGDRAVNASYIAVPGWGETFAYGLAAAPLAAAEHAPMLLVGATEPNACASNDPSKDTLCYLNGNLKSKGQQAQKVFIAGSAPIIGDAVASAFADAAGLAKDVTPPPVPSASAVDTPEDDGTHVTVSWSPVDDPQGGAVTYKVWSRAAGVGNYVLKTAAPVTGTTFMVGGLTKNTPYDFGVSAVDRYGNESARDEVLAVTPTDEVPATPVGPPAVERVQTGLMISWAAAPEADANGYRIQRKDFELLSGCGGLLSSWTTLTPDVSGKATTSVVDTSAQANRRYCYRYQVIDTTNNASGFSPAAESP